MQGNRLETDHLRLPVGPGALHVARYGFGDIPVVLLHGFGTSAFLWRAVAPALPLGAVTAVAMDLLGHGESDQPPEADVRIPAQAEYVERAMTALRMAEAVVVGVDLGATVALRLAATRPDRVRALVLFSPPHPERARGEDLDALQREAARNLVHASGAMLGATALLGPVLGRAVSRPDAMPERLVARYAAPFVGPSGVRHLLSLARAVDDDALADCDLRLVRAPTLLLRGEGDPWCTAAQVEALAGRLGRPTARSHPGGRLLGEEDPREAARLVGAWATTATP